MSRSAHLEELRLTAFKSFRDAVLPLKELTLLIGRNGGGKSNAIDGLVALSRLASGEEIREALEDTRLGTEPIRGGAEGRAPFGLDGFTLGCLVRSGSALHDFRVEVQVRPDLRITKERLSVVEGVSYSRRSLAHRDLLATEGQAAGRMDIMARCFNGKRGVDPPFYFSSNRLLLPQVPSRVRADTDAFRLVHDGAATVLAALGEVFVLDPVPHPMRQYVNEKDDDLRRNAQDLSAAVALLRRSSPESFTELESAMMAMPERPFEGITAARSTLGDVLVALDEKAEGGKTTPVSARLMSDGMLRFLAFGTALLSAPLVEEPVETKRTLSEDVAGQRTLVFEEVENGLHPTMAARVISLVKRESERRRIRTLVTSHSPALLNALRGKDHDGVIVCDRDPASGWSRLHRLVDLPGYPELMAQGDLGDAVSRGNLPAATNERTKMSEEFSELLGGL